MLLISNQYWSSLSASSNSTSTDDCSSAAISLVVVQWTLLSSFVTSNILLLLQIHPITWNKVWNLIVSRSHFIMHLFGSGVSKKSLVVSSSGVWRHHPWRWGLQLSRNQLSRQAVTAAAVARTPSSIRVKIRGSQGRRRRRHRAATSGATNKSQQRLRQREL